MNNNEELNKIAQQAAKEMETNTAPGQAGVPNMTKTAINPLWNREQIVSNLPAHVQEALSKMGSRGV